MSGRRKLAIWVALIVAGWTFFYGLYKGLETVFS